MTVPLSAPYASVVVVAAGRGERFGQSPKILALAGGRPVLAWSLIAASRSACVREIVVVTGQHTDEAIRHLVDELTLDTSVTFVAGGHRRQDSVVSGVAAVSLPSEVVLVHDAARPMATVAMFDACAEEAQRSGAAIVATPVSDTLKRVRDLAIVETVDRTSLWSAQTPQGFRLDVIRRAIEETRTRGAEFSDEASLLEALEEPVGIVPGDRTNIKITHPEDLELVDALLWRRSMQAQE